MFFRFSLVVWATVCLYSCGGEKVAKKKDLTAAERKSIEKEELLNVLNFDAQNDSAKIQNYWITTARELTKFYELNKQELFWFKDGKLRQHTAEFMKFLSESEYYGLDSNFYYFNQLNKGLDSLNKITNFYSVAKTEAINDVLLTNAWLLAAVHLNKGLLDPENLKVIWKKDSLENKNLASVLHASGDTSFMRTLLSYEPNFIEYRQLKAAVKNFLDRNQLDTVSFELADPKKDSVGCWQTVAKALLHWKYIDSLTVVRDTLVARAKKFQADNGLDPDAIMGFYSRKAFGQSNAKRFYASSLAFEKWRWKEKRDGKIQFHVNIPSFMLHVIRNDSIIRRHRVVTGAPDTRSPQFKAKIRYVTLFPYWHVPHSISTKEIAPYLRRDSSYLRKCGYSLLNFKNEPIDLSTVKWKSLSENYFPYKIRQHGGYGNSLGIVAFHFPNKYDVYLHDTPSKRFFSKSVRAFSHGCIRLQNPVDMATFILQQDVKWKKDEFNKDTLMTWINRRYEQRINLKKPIPIEIDYITVTGDSLGKITFHPDVYDKEIEMRELMNPQTKFKPKKKPVKKKEEAEEVKTAAVIRKDENTVN